MKYIGVFLLFLVCACSLFKHTHQINKPTYYASTQEETELKEECKYLEALKCLDTFFKDSIPFIDKVNYKDDILSFRFVNPSHKTLYLLTGLFFGSNSIGLLGYLKRADTLKKKLYLSYQPIYPTAPSALIGYRQERYAEVPPHHYVPISVGIKNAWNSQNFGILSQSNTKLTTQSLDTLKNIDLSTVPNYPMVIQVAYYPFIPYSGRRFVPLDTYFRDSCNSSYLLTEKETIYSVRQIYSN